MPKVNIILVVYYFFLLNIFPFFFFLVSLSIAARRPVNVVKLVNPLPETARPFRIWAFYAGMVGLKRPLTSELDPARPGSSSVVLFFFFLIP